LILIPMNGKLSRLYRSKVSSYLAVQLVKKKIFSTSVTKRPKNVADYQQS